MEYKINEAITEHRRTLGLTQEQLGAQLGVSGQAVSKWEKGESMPDILLLPELCDIFGISVDALLGHRSAMTAGVMQQFCATARREGRSHMVLEAIGSLFNDVGRNYGERNYIFAANTIRAYDGQRREEREGMGFVMTGEVMKDTLRAAPADVAHFLAPLTDETALTVLAHTSPEYAITEAELLEACDIDEATLDRILLALMKRDILCYDADPYGKRGYLQSASMLGVYMILAGCAAVDYGGEPQGNFWMSRSPQLPS